MNTAVSACWRADDARAIFVTEALEGDDAIFLATHTPIVGFDVAGRDAAEIQGLDERAVLETLSDSTRKHAFCVVEGEPGSGKSHLIRWLSVNWPHSNDIKLLLRRADGSLDGALRQLRDRLPTEFAPLFDNLGQRHKASQQGRSNIFLSTLANTLEPGHFDTPLSDESWCRQFSPSTLLTHPAIKSAWKSPARILNLLEGAAGERNSATASFDLFDVQELAKLSRPLVGLASTLPCQELIRRLDREADTIDTFKEQEWLASELATEQADRFPTSLALIEALNLRRNDAIQNVLGVSAQGLKTLFRQVREALAERSQRLVLLLEDITSWEGLDDSLIDVLVFNASARGDVDEKPVCPLISVVGVTPAYYVKLQGNYRQRITHEVKLGQATSGLQDVATLRETETRRQFAARYLSAVRVGPVALENWLREFRDGHEIAPPNRCETCPRQDRCFDTFGQEEGIGLFPFTKHSLDRFFDALKENDNGQTWKTPRGILQAILNPNLLQPDSLADGTYPGHFIESEAFRPDRRSDGALAPRLRQIVANKIDSPNEQARMRRMLAYWADPNRSDTEAVGEDLNFAGTSRAVFEAFGLPWIGGSASVVSQPAASAVHVAQPIFEPTTDDVSEDDDRSTGLVRAGSPIRSPRPVVTAPKPKRLTLNRTELEVLREQIRSWNSGGLENGSKWNEILYTLAEQVRPRVIGVTPPLFNKFITRDMVKLQGTALRSLNYFTLPAEPWTRNGLEAFVSLKLDTALTVPDAEYHRRSLATMMRRLENNIATFLDSRIPRLLDGKRWSPVSTFAQILLARAYLRGATSVEATMTDQMRAVLSDEGLSDTDFSARSVPWQEWLTATKGFHERLRVELRGMVRLNLSDSGDGTSGGDALVDASEFAGAIARFSESGKFDPVPEENGGLPDVYRKARELAQHWSEKRLQIERIEYTQMKGRCETLSTLLRSKDIKTHLSRLDNCISGTAQYLPSAATDKVQAWKLAFTKLAPRLQDGASARVEDIIISFEEDGAPVKLLQRLAWLARQPARELDDILTTAQIGERAIDELRNHARDCVHEAGSGSLDEVKIVGKALQAAVERSDQGEKQTA